MTTEQKKNFSFYDTERTNLDLEQADPAEIKKRSVVIAGHRTSISLENAFWVALREIAQSRRTSVNQLVSEIDKNRQGNLSSAIRTTVLLHYWEK